ncbi:MAG: hypothetical protein AAF352_02075 [Pseudomonadota bacterium]
MKAKARHILARYGFAMISCMLIAACGQNQNLLGNLVGGVTDAGKQDIVIVDPPNYTRKNTVLAGFVKKSNPVASSASQNSARDQLKDQLKDKDKVEIGSIGNDFSDLRDDRLQQFISLNPTDLVRTIGEPYFARKDGDIAIWQYRHANCRMDLFLYPQPRLPGKKVVRHAELWDVETREKLAGGACVLGLLQTTG